MLISARRPNPVLSDEYRALREELIAARRQAGLTQTELAARLGKTKSHVCLIEKGQRRVDSLELYMIARCIGLPPSELFTRIARRLDGFFAAHAMAAE